MKYRILHESSYRMRVHMMCGTMTVGQADYLEYQLNRQPFIRGANVFHRSGNVVIRYERSESGREQVENALCDFCFCGNSENDYETTLPAPMPKSGRAVAAAYQEKIIRLILGNIMRRLFLPAPVNTAWTALTGLRFLKKAIRSIAKRKLSVSVLDAVTIGISLLRGDVNTASSIMLFLDIGETLQQWTYRRSAENMANIVSMGPTHVWRSNEDKEETFEPVTAILSGDRIVLRTSQGIPFDGKLISGKIQVNQASITGNWQPVEKSAGGYVYAGTVVVSGTAIMEVVEASTKSRYHQLVTAIEDSGKLSADSEAITKAVVTSDKMVPYTFAAAALTGLVTKNANKALSALMVDFSCGLELSVPMAMLSATQEAYTRGIFMKGGSLLETMAQADTIVFDKSGTLTKGSPKVTDIISITGKSEKELLQLAACLEEHYPHAMADAVVAEAKRRGLHHDNLHAQVEYVEAHGIVSAVDNREVIIGSRHFVLEDKGVLLPEHGKNELENIPDNYSRLYLAMDGNLEAVLCIAHEVKEEARPVMDALRKEGVENIYLMTGDDERAAKVTAETLQVDTVYSQMLPEKKAALVRREQEAGKTVVVVADGISDAAALLAADIGICSGTAAAIALEAADCILYNDKTRDPLYGLVTLRQMSLRLRDRIRGKYKRNILFNAGLLVLGMLDVVRPGSLALAHNAATVYSGITAMKQVLPEEFAGQRE